MPKKSAASGLRTPMFLNTVGSGGCPEADPAGGTCVVAVAVAAGDPATGLLPGAAATGVPASGVDSGEGIAAAAVAGAGATAPADAAPAPPGTAVAPPLGGTLVGETQTLCSHTSLPAHSLSPRQLLGPVL